MTKFEYMQLATLAIIVGKHTQNMENAVYLATKLTDELWKYAPDDNGKGATISEEVRNDDFTYLAQTLLRVDKSFRDIKNEECGKNGWRRNAQLSGFAVKFLKTMSDAQLKNVGQLLDNGRIWFRCQRNVGEKMVEALDNALDICYGIKSW